MGVDAAIDLTTEQRRTVLELLDRYLPGTAAWVYGSRAKRTSRPQSDLDLVVFTTPEQQRQVGNLRTTLEESNLPFRVDLFVWNDVSEVFRREIERKHVVLLKGSHHSSAADWRTVFLGECISINTSTYSPKENWPFINYLDTGSITDNRIDKIQHLIPGRDQIPSSARRKVRPGEIVYSNVRPRQRHFGLLKNTPENLLVSTGFSVIRGKNHVACTDFIYWFLTQEHIAESLHTIAEQQSSAYPSIKPADIERLTSNLPPLAEQRAIAHILGTLNDMIELNRRMNRTLEAMARALFKSWFVDFDPVRAKMEGRDTGLPKHLADLFPDALDKDMPVGWKSKPLDEIAYFHNGLALQKYPASDPSKSLPVIKIAELRRGITEKSNRASREIPERYVVADGDFLFSWSGSLLAKFWTEGQGALNQHLFKVTSDRYPAWFFSRWVDHYMEEFQAIAASKKTTMGHIQRRHLSEAIATCPPDDVLSCLGKTVGPLVECIIKNDLEVRTLAETRDTLLPKLISGEIRLRDTERAMEAVA